MKTAVSIPDALFESADLFAEQAKLSRSELYARALRAYLDVHAEERVTAQLDAIASELEADVAQGRAARAALLRTEWDE